MRERLFSRGSILGSRRGQTLVEFAMASIVILMLIFGVVEFGRIVLVYNSIANGARIGARYAITNSSPPSGVAVSASTIQTNVQTVVKNFLAPTTVNINNASCVPSGPVTALSICANFPTTTTVGNLVQVTVSYPYDLLIPYYPINITLSSTSEGIITW